jgi:hypothetical protein
MAYIILPHRWMRQPTAPLRLRAAWRPYIAFAHVPAGVQPDLVSSTLPTLAGTVNYRGTPHGVAMVPADDNSGFTWARTPLYDTATNGCAVLTIAAPAAQAEVDRHFALGDGAAGAYNQLTFGFNMDYGGSAASGSWSVLEYNSGYQTRSQTLSSSIVDGGWHVWIASRPAGSINYYSLVRDGFNQSLIPGSSSSGITLTAGINLQAPQSTATGQGSEHPSVLTVLFNRAMRSSELGAFTNIPDVFGELFEPLQRRIYVPSAGGGGPQVYEDDHAQAAGAADTLAAQLLAQIAIAHAAGASDQVLAQTIAQAVSEHAGGAADFVAAQLVALATNVESAGISDTVAAMLVALASEIEAAGAGFDVAALFGRFGHPVSDVSNTGWVSTGASLYGVLNEAARDDAGYIEATGAAVAKLALTQHADPGSTPHAIKIASPPGYTPEGTLTVRLYCGVTLIATWTITDLAADEERQLDLTSGERDAITDYTDLSVEVEASA